MASEGEQGDRGRIKGNAIREFIAWYLSLGHREQLVAAIRRLELEEQALFDFDHRALGILPSTWYSGLTVHRVLDGMLEGMSRREVEALATAGGQVTADTMMTGLYKAIFTAVMTPSRFAKLANMAWRTSYDNGWVDNEVLGPGRHRAVVREWGGHHHFLCKLNVAVKARIYVAMGCQEVLVEDRYCVSDGRSECGSLISWREG
ncbi:MAG: hypothetical protein R3B09_19365 [Nannocystaceae bacterium]